MGYILTGLDVFVWVLLTAGTILVPVVVLTICCIRNHYKNEKRLNSLYRLKEQKGSGNVGPYSSYQDHLNRGEKPPASSINPGTIIVNSALGDISSPIIINDKNGNETPNTTERNKVRFSDDNSNRRMNQYNNNNNNNFDKLNENNFQQPPSSDLRGLKDAVNQFIPRPTVKPLIKPNSNNNNNNQLPLLPNLQYDQFLNENNSIKESGSYNLPSLMINKNNNQQRQQLPQVSQQQESPVGKDPVYSISNSYRFNDERNQIPQVLNQVQPRVSASIENIYSKVLTRPKNNNQNIDDQPLYMNAPQYTTTTTQNREEIDYSQLPPNIINPSLLSSWNDSSV